MGINRLLSILNLAILFLTFFSVSGCGSGSADIHYVSMGASDTLGIGADPISDGYTFQIEDRLDELGKDTELTNVGIPGAQINFIRDTELQLAKEKDPDLITIFVGPNDIIDGVGVDTFEENLQAILKQLVEETPAFVVIGTIPDFTTAPRFQSNPDPNVTVERIAQFNEAILRQASANHVAVAELRGQQVDSDVTASDGFHPNGEGYTLMANAYLKVIEPHFFPNG